ncbi:MAG: hypothetical protein E7457_04725 [Ruminococcaceae bacterium]|nr:hypothetical protein [Oscillospiraceae bacterium]
MDLHYVIIDPTRNTTLLVTNPVPRDLQPRLAARLLQREPDAEQVGFVERFASFPGRLQMMGGEFCGNASMGFAAWLCQQVPVGETRELTLEISGAPQPVACSVTTLPDCWLGTVQMPLPESIQTISFPLEGGQVALPVVCLPGIHHIVVPAQLLTRQQAEAVIRSWSRQLCAEAVGILLVEESPLHIAPLVYVKPTDTAVWERGCGSGSAAVGAWLSHRDQADCCVSVRQPGGTIAVTAHRQEGVLTVLTISGTVKLLQEKDVKIFL